MDNLIECINTISIVMFGQSPWMECIIHTCCLVDTNEQMNRMKLTDNYKSAL